MYPQYPFMPFILHDCVFEHSIDQLELIIYNFHLKAIYRYVIVWTINYMVENLCFCVCNNFVKILSCKTTKIEQQQINFWAPKKIRGKICSYLPDWVYGGIYNMRIIANKVFFYISSVRDQTHFYNWLPLNICWMLCLQIWWLSRAFPHQKMVTVVPH